MSTAPSLPYSDLDPAKWRDYADLRLGSLWIDPARGPVLPHQKGFYGGYIPQLADQLLMRYTREDDLVLDPFMGSGTSLIQALGMNRRAVGSDLSVESMTAVAGAILPAITDGRARVMTGDAADIATVDRAREHLIDLRTRAGESLDTDPRADLLILHPPYADIIRFSDDPRDLSTREPYAFLKEFARVATLWPLLLRPGRFCALIIGDCYAKGAVVPLGFQTMACLTGAGLVLKSVIVKNMAGNARGKGKSANLWRYRALRGGFSIFEHEYVFVLQKPLKSSIPIRIRSGEVSVYGG